jgi:hypothetical protein
MEWNVEGNVDGWNVEGNHVGPYPEKGCRENVKLA